MYQNILIILICIIAIVVLYNLCAGAPTLSTLFGGLIGGLLLAKYSNINISSFSSPKHKRSESFTDAPPLQVLGRDVVPEPPIDISEPPKFNRWNDTTIDNMGLFDGGTAESGKPLSGDDQLCVATRSMNEKNKQSILNRTRYNSENHKINFTEELDTKEDLIWWENNDHLDSQMVKDGVQF